MLYPISPPDPATGLATINWIAEITVDNAGGWQNGDWNKKVRHEAFVHHFERWTHDWIDIPAMLRGTDDEAGGASNTAAQVRLAASQEIRGSEKRQRNTGIGAAWWLIAICVCIGVSIVVSAYWIS